MLTSENTALIKYALAMTFGFLIIGGNLPAKGDVFNINLTFSGLSASQQTIFTSAELTWESIITGYADGFVLPGDGFLDIAATGTAIDGTGGVLGSAGPTSGVASSNYVYAKTGEMNFDSADLDALEASGALYDVILHEMAHVIGFGTLWSSSAIGAAGYQELYVSGTGQYTGAQALAQYQLEYDPLATYVPVELGGGSGTANGHWDEVDGGSADTGIIGPDGDIRYELMTGWLNSPTYISNTTIGSFADLGYIVAYNVQAVPEPSTWLLSVASLGLVVLRRKRKSQSVNRKTVAPPLERDLSDY